MNRNTITTSFRALWLAAAILFTLLLFSPEGIAQGTSNLVIRVNSELILTNVLTKGDSAQVTLESAFPNGMIFVTLDNSTPSYASTPYRGAFTATNSVTIRAIAYSEDFARTAEVGPLLLTILPTYTVAVAVVGSGTVAISPMSDRYLSNSVVTVTATANTANGWEFSHWAGDASGEGPILTVNVNANKRIQAVFALTQFQLQASTAGGGRISVTPPNGPYARNVAVNLQAIPDDGWSFIRWAGDVNDTNAMVEITMDQTKMVQAIFGTWVNTSIPTHGKIVIQPAQGPFAYGSVLEATAIPEASYAFVMWGNAFQGFLNPHYYTVTEPHKTISALFGPSASNQVNLLTPIVGNGTIKREPDKAVYTLGETITLTAIPNGLGTFDRWAGDALGRANPLVVVLDGDKTIRANFSSEAVVAWNGCPSPTNVHDVVTLSAGAFHGLALQANGKVVGWGGDSYGSADYGGIRVPLGLSNVVAISGGYYHSVALKEDGTVAAWGYNVWGQTNVPTGLTNVVAISAGFQHNLALKDDGTVVAWGGQDTRGATVIPPGLSDVVAIAAGCFHSLALKSDGTVVAWGVQSGDSEYKRETDIPNGLAGVVAIGANVHFSAALKQDGTVAAWGNWGYSATPANVPDGLVGVVALSVGPYNCLVLKDDGTTLSFGNNGAAAGPTNLTSAVAVAAGASFNLALVKPGPPLAYAVMPRVSVRSRGGKAIFWASAVGQYPLWYQWRKDGVDLPGATRPVLILDNLQNTNAGNYTMVVRNLSGSSESKPANLVVNNQSGQAAYALSTAAVGQGTISVNPITNSYASNTLVRLTAQPDTTNGWVFNRWLGGAAGTSPTLDLLMYRNQAVQAIFVLPQFALTTTAVGDGVIATEPPEGPYYVNREVRLMASPARNWTFSHWEGDAEGANLLCRLNMDQAKSVRAVFVRSRFFLSATTKGGGSIVVDPPQGPYPSNSVVTLSPYPDAGWTFLKWMGKVEGSNAATTVILNTDEWVTAVFGTTLTLDPGANGTVVVKPSAGPYPFGSFVELTAVPNSGYVFGTWKNGVQGARNPYYLQATQAMLTVSATFATRAANQVTLTTPVTGEGSVQRDPDKAIYTQGELVTLTAIPAVTTTFDGWSGDSAARTNRITITMDADKTIRASFVNGAVYAWWYNGNGSGWPDYGQTKAPPNLTGVLAVDAGGNSGLALKQDGTLAAWGSYDNGQTLARVPSGLSDVVAISAGYYFCLALKGDGKVAVWGQNSGINIDVPVSLTNVVAISAGDSHALALRGDGTVFAWGNNYNGQTNVPPGLSEVIAIAAGSAHNLVLKRDGTVVVWGSNDNGESEPPAGVCAGKAITAGRNNCLVVKEDGSLIGWGNNYQGIIVPPAGFTGVATARLGIVNTLAIKDDSTMLAWGDMNMRYLPAGLRDVVIAVPAGGGHGVALARSGPPTVISVMPRTVTVDRGTTAMFWVYVSGHQSLAYQWRKDGGDLAGQTHPYLALDDVRDADSGSYTVLVRNPAGSVESSPATLSLRGAYQPSRHLNVAAGPGGTITRNPNRADYLDGERVVVTATPDNGYGFAGWTGDSTAATATINVVMNGDKSLTAVFKPLRTLSVSTTGQGTVNQSTNAASYLDGTVVLLTASAANGWQFTGWQGALSGSQNPISITLGADKAVQAVFKQLFTVSLLPSFGQGAVSVNPPQASYVDGTMVRVTATAASGYHFSNWGGSLSGAINPVDLVVDGNKNVTAVFTVNVAPSVAIISPANNPSLFAPLDLLIQVSAIGQNGSVRRVDFYAGTNVLGAITNSPYNFIWTNVPPGTYSLTAQATDEHGAAGVSSPVAITVVPSPIAETGLRFPADLPPHDGSLFVSLRPAAAGGQWHFAWEPLWRDGDTLVTGLSSDNYDLEFKPVGGFIQPPGQTVPITAGSSAAVTNYYIATASPQVGSLTVLIQPGSVAQQAQVASRGQWRRQGESLWHDSGETLGDLNAGVYFVEFKSVADWVAPAQRTVSVLANQGNTIAVTYWVGDSTIGTKPTPLLLRSITQDPNSPYAYSGQLLSDAGYASGFVVKERVVLTAAHVVYNDATNGYLSGVKWFFQRHVGDYDPKPQTPRGWYVFDGYAAQRKADNTPGQSSPTAQNLDVAALFFLQPAGRGGYGGYLPSKQDNNEWLLSDRNKVLIGYPVQTVPESDRGKMHATLPLDVSFHRITGQVYATADITSYPGNSGGPVCVLYDNGKYYPAAIYLGGSAQTVVRGLDSQVTDLINRAEVSGNGGGNNVGGGVNLLETTLTGSPFMPGFLSVTLQPAAATQAGAGWRIAGGDTNYMTATLLPLLSARYTVEFKPVPGFTTPASWSVQVTTNQTTTIIGTYAASGPLLSFKTGQGLSLNGTIGNTYRIEYTDRLQLPIQWTPLTTNRLASGSITITNTQPTKSLNRFYRAVSVP